MNCPHCNMPVRKDWACEYTCGSVTLRGRLTRSPICYANEIAQLKAKVKRLEEAGDVLEVRADCHCGEFVCNSCRNASEAWTKAKATQ
jgi:hypothetical protein